MRIVGGQWRGRGLVAPPGREVRPTSDRAREALFNILENNPAFADFSVPGACALDAFAGTGALGLEALSRRAARAIFFETEPQALVALRTNIKRLGAGPRALVYAWDATRPGRASEPCDLVFLDPPYGSALAGPTLDALAAGGWIADAAVVAVELAKREALAPPAGFNEILARGYGAARLVFLRAERA